MPQPLCFITSCLLYFFLIKTDQTKSKIYFHLKKKKKIPWGETFHNVDVLFLRFLLPGVYIYLSNIVAGARNEQEGKLRAALASES